MLQKMTHYNLTFTITFSCTWWCKHYKLHVANALWRFYCKVLGCTVRCKTVRLKRLKTEWLSSKLMNTDIYHIIPYRTIAKWQIHSGDNEHCLTIQAMDVHFCTKCKSLVQKHKIYILTKMQSCETESNHHWKRRLRLFMQVNAEHEQ